MKRKHRQWVLVLSGTILYKRPAPMILQCLGVNRSQTLKHRTEQLNIYDLNLKGKMKEIHIFPVKRWIF